MYKSVGWIIVWRWIGVVICHSARPYMDLNGFCSNVSQDRSSYWVGVYASSSSGSWALGARPDSVSLSSSWCSSCCGLQVGDESLIGLVLVQFLYTEVPLLQQNIWLLSSSGPNITSLSSTVGTSGYLRYRRYLKMHTWYLLRYRRYRTSKYRTAVGGTVGTTVHQAADCLQVCK